MALWGIRFFMGSYDALTAGLNFSSSVLGVLTRTPGVSLKVAVDPEPHTYSEHKE